MDLTNSEYLLFICATPGNGGHRLGRIISCFDNVYWYSHPNNGKDPSDIFYNEVVKGKSISPYHYDRLTEISMIPLVGERIEKYWHEEDYDYFYRVVWNELITEAGAADIIIQKKYLTWIIHDDPNYIRSRFPNSKIINLIDNDIDQVVNRYLKTTAYFPASIDNPKTKPYYQTIYATQLEKIKQVNKKPTLRDMWAWVNYEKYFFDDIMLPQYFLEIKKEISDLNLKKTKAYNNMLNINWETLNIDNLKNFLNASNIDHNYIKLLK